MPIQYRENGLRLGGWVNAQRTKYGRGELTADRRDRLEGLAGWVWDHNEERWERNFAVLLSYVAKHGTAQVASDYLEGTNRLGSWVNVQRQKGINGRLDPDRLRRLDELPSWTWRPQDAKWEAGFDRLKRYVDEHGDSRVHGALCISPSARSTPPRGRWSPPPDMA